MTDLISPENARYMNNLIHGRKVMALLSDEFMYQYLHPRRDPEQRLNPPEADSKTIERNLLNSVRGDCVDALNTLEDRLDELGRLFPDSFRELREELRGEMED